MNDRTFTDLPDEEKRWIESYVSESISSDDFQAMQDRLAESSEFRAALRSYLALDSHLAGSWEDETQSPWLVAADTATGKSTTNNLAFPFAIAAGFAILLGISTIALVMEKPDSSAGAGETENVAEGFAVIERLSNPVWSANQKPLLEGDTIAAESLRLDSGAAEIQFFSGAKMIVGGPAEIVFTSAWEAQCIRGSVRMQVPPAARGFKLHAPDTEIVDLGTEFGLVVQDGTSEIAVFDGEVELRHRDGEKRLVREGAAWNLPTEGSEAPAPFDETHYLDRTKLLLNPAKQQTESFARWQSHRERLASDPRLIAYYTFEKPNAEVPDLAHPGDEERSGTIVLAEPVRGRWENHKTALEFKRPGARVRVNIPGQFSAYTFSCWVRIDSLDRRYSGLFLGDGYENGEPHWQIRDDGKLMLSVMVDDTRKIPNHPESNGLHRVYFSEPVWDMSMSGQWMHITSIFDPTKRFVSHYVNGKQVSNQTIEDEYFVKDLRIGNGEIGNWGQPLRRDPTFAIRNLNGRMGELAIFDAALTPDEVTELFEQSRKKF